MRRRFVCLLMIFLVVSSGTAYALTGANTGLTGLWEYPTAEMPSDGVGRFGYTHASPYAFYFLDLAWLPWFEVNARFSTFDTVRANNYTDSEGNPIGRDYMDKAIDLKLMLYDNYNSPYWFVPSVAAGVVDMMGTELMKAWYGAATWHWGNVSATLGYGTDRLNGVYAGIEWDIADWLTFKAEYSPLDYSKDSVGNQKVLRDLPSSKYNFGLVFRAPWGTEGSVSWQRGDEFVFTISQKINLSGPYIGGDKKPYGQPGDYRIADWKDIDSEELIKRIKSGLEKYVRVRDVDIKLEKFEFENNNENEEEENKNEEKIEGYKLTLAYENYGHASHAEAMMRILVVLSAVMPETDNLTLIQKISGVPIVRADFPGSLLFDIRSRGIRDNDNPLKGANFYWANNDDKKIEENSNAKILEGKARHELKGMIVYEPRLDQTLKDDYMDRWSIDLVYKGRYAYGWGALVDVRFPIDNDVNIWWEPDMNDDIRLQRAAATYMANLTKDGRTWLFGEGGWLDEEWFGMNIWGRYYAKNGNWWVGARVSAQRARDPFSFAGLTDGELVYYNGRTYDVGDEPWRPTAWIQAGYNIRDLDLDIQADYGRYIDNDRGFKIALVRHWDDTALGFWMSKTDVLAPDRDYTRAGVHMEIPAEKWFGTLFGRSSEHIWEQDTVILSTYMIDSGREGGMIRTPERLLGQMRPIALKKNVEVLLQEYCSFDDENSEREDKQTVRSLMEYILRKKKK